MDRPRDRPPHPKARRARRGEHEFLLHESRLRATSRHFGRTDGVSRLHREGTATLCHRSRHAGGATTHRSHGRREWRDPRAGDRRRVLPEPRFRPVRQRAHCRIAIGDRHAQRDARVHLHGECRRDSPGRSDRGSRGGGDSPEVSGEGRLLRPDLRGPRTTCAVDARYPDWRDENHPSGGHVAGTRPVLPHGPHPVDVLPRGSMASARPHLDDRHRYRRGEEDSHADHGAGDCGTRILEPGRPHHLVRSPVASRGELRPARCGRGDGRGTHVHRAAQ